MGSATIFEAKNHFSRIIKRVEGGETIVITSGRAKREVAKIVPVAPVESTQAISKQRLGAWYAPDFELGDAFWHPMTDEECGYGDDVVL